MVSSRSIESGQESLSKSEVDIFETTTILPQPNTRLVAGSEGFSASKHEPVLELQKQKSERRQESEPASEPETEPEAERQTGRREVEHRTVLIIGAGPAGSLAAERLSEAGIDALIIEKRAVVGNPAQCGECVPGWGEMIGTFPKLESENWLAERFDYPTHAISRRLDWMRVFTPRMKPYGFELDCYSAHRLQFDGHLAEQALKAGAEIRLTEALQNVLDRRGNSPDLYVTNRGRYTADWVIDASGALGHVRRLLGQVDRPAALLPSIYAQVEGDLPPTFDIYIGGVAPAGYAWVIPKDGIANVGIGIKPGAVKRPLRELLDAFCDSLNVEILSYGGGYIPMGGAVRNVVFRNIMSVGDAAGLVMPSNGGGIGQAMVSGMMAAEAIIDAKERGASLNHYQDRLHDVFAKPLKISLRTKRMFWHFGRNDALIELGLRLLGRSGIRRAVDCRRPFFIV